MHCSYDSIFDFRKRNAMKKMAAPLQSLFWLLTRNVISYVHLSLKKRGNGLRSKSIKFLQTSHNPTKEYENVTSLFAKPCLFPLHLTKFRSFPSIPYYNGNLLKNIPNVAQEKHLKNIDFLRKISCFRCQCLKQGIVKLFKNVCRLNIDEHKPQYMHSR